MTVVARRRRRRRCLPLLPAAACRSYRSAAPDAHSAPAVLLRSISDNGQVSILVVRGTNLVQEVGAAAARSHGCVAVTAEEPAHINGAACPEDVSAVHGPLMLMPDAQCRPARGTRRRPPRPLRWAARCWARC